MATKQTPTNPIYDVFISYSSKDRAWVKNFLVATLEAKGLKVCIDYRDFRPGYAIVDEIERGLEQSRKVLCILTPHYLEESEWTNLEYLMVQTRHPANREGRFLVVLKSPCELPTSLKPFIYVDFTAGADHDLEWNRLLPSLVDTEAIYSRESRPPASNNIKLLAAQLQEWKVIHSHTQRLLLSLETVESRFREHRRVISTKTRAAIECNWNAYCEPKVRELLSGFKTLVFISDKNVQELHKILTGENYVFRCIWDLQTNDISSFTNFQNSFYDLKSRLITLLTVTDLRIIDISEAIQEID